MARQGRRRRRRRGRSVAAGLALSAAGLFSPSATVGFLPSLPPPRPCRDIRRGIDDSPRKLLGSLPTASRLAYHPSDEPLSERIRGVQAEWEGVAFIQNVKDKLDAAEKLLQANAESAEANAADVIEQGESEDYLLKPFAEGMFAAGEALAKEMMEVRQEYDELKASKMVEESTEDVVRTVVLVEKGENNKHRLLQFDI